MGFAINELLFSGFENLSVASEATPKRSLLLVKALAAVGHLRKVETTADELSFRSHVAGFERTSHEAMPQHRRRDTVVQTTTRRSC